MPYFYFRSEIWHHCRVPRPQFPNRRGNFGDSRKFKAEIGKFMFMFAWIFMAFWPKMAVLEAKYGKGWCVIDPQQTRSYFWRLLPLCHFWQKSIKKCDRESADRHTHKRRQTDFIICPMLYAIAVGQIIIQVTFRGQTWVDFHINTYTVGNKKGANIFLSVTSSKFNGF